MDYTQLNEFAASVKAIVAYPDARSDPKTLAPPSWVMTGTSERDFLRALVSDAATVHQIDSKKIYLTGISQGADVASLITCQDAGFYAGLASVAIINHHVSDCGDAPPIPVLSFVSSDDPIYSIDNGLILAVPDPDPPRSLAEESSGWAQRNLCKGEPVEDVLTPELTARTYGCDGAPFVVYVHHSGHVWPSEAKQGIDGNELIWKFLTAGD